MVIHSYCHFVTVGGEVTASSGLSRHVEGLDDVEEANELVEAHKSLFAS